jgi:hypothetical protein
MGDRYEMLRANGQPSEFFSCTPAEEGAYLRRADVVVARRDEEARSFDSVTGRNTAVVIPHRGTALCGEDVLCAPACGNGCQRQPNQSSHHQRVPGGH